MVVWPAMLMMTRLSNANALVRGLSLGACFHVSAVAALSSADDTTAADFAGLDVNPADCMLCFVDSL